MKQIMSNKEYYTRKLLDCYTKEELLGNSQNTTGLLTIFVSKEGDGLEVELESKQDKFMEGYTFTYKGGKAKW